MKKIKEIINIKEFFKAWFIVLLYFLIIPFIVSAIALLFLKETPNTQMLALLNVIVYVVDLIIVLFIFRKDLKKEWQNYTKNFKTCFSKAIKYWLCGLLCMVISNMIIVTLLKDIAANEAANRELLNQLPVLSILAMTLLGPILEELTFRKNFKKAFKTKKAFLICTALFFGGAHVINNIDFTSITNFLNTAKELLYIVPYASLGYYFAKSYYETDSIFTSITCHILHNTLTVIIVLTLAR